MTLQYSYSSTYAIHNHLSAHVVGSVPVSHPSMVSLIVATHHPVPMNDRVVLMYCRR